MLGKQDVFGTSYRIACLLSLIHLIGESALCQSTATSRIFEVRDYGAKGDGKSLDSPMINAAIEAASQAGGGTVHFPHGTYRSFSIRLKSNITLLLDRDATILAADSPMKASAPGYDPPEPNPSDQFQDFGHSHWHDALIWGDDVENVRIMGEGKIDGAGLSRGNNPQRRTSASTPLPGAVVSKPLAFGAASSISPPPAAPRINSPADHRVLHAGVGDKAISLKLCRNVTIQDITIARGGHFAILATGTDGLRVSNVQIDTNRDGIDIDSCKSVELDHCMVNAPFDDAIALKTSCALGAIRSTEDVKITSCKVSGFDVGSVLNGTRKKAPDLGAEVTSIGRITFGTESAGGFRHIAISDCSFESCAGLAISSVDGAVIEDISVDKLAMKDITNAPIFLRLGRRMRSPTGTPVGSVRGVSISHVNVINADPRFGSIISGMPGHLIQDIKLSDIQIQYQGGGTKQWAELVPPENPTITPQAQMFGNIPAYGFFIRHAQGVELSSINLTYRTADARPPVQLQDVQNTLFMDIKAEREQGVPFFCLKNVASIQARNVVGITDFSADAISEQMVDR